MSKLKLTGKELRAIGFPEGPVISIAMNVLEKSFTRKDKSEVLQSLRQVLAEPKKYFEDETLGKIAEALLPKTVIENFEIPLKNISVDFNIFGGDYIEAGALEQMNYATKLPIAIAGALMPDAHQGYGLPIGGVLATENAVIPYGVGVDIGCRMCLSIFDINPDELAEKESYYKRIILDNTLFGAGKEFKKPVQHEIMDRKEFYEIGLLRQLQSKAAAQIGSSGSGNHFVEFGTIDLSDPDSYRNDDSDMSFLGIPKGKYVGLLSHSGSRGLGANIANHFTNIAKLKRQLPKSAANLSWFTLDEDEGIQYWKAMNLAGDYASACHHIIHAKIAKQMGREPLKMVENHHNFAWKEMYNGKEVIVHRKGATPAGKDVMGIIPGSMTAPGFIVKGKGEEASLSSAAHGAGRRMSRTAAIKSITHETMNEELKKHGVKLIGGGLDEAPQAYKDIESVMQSQKQLVEVVGKFYPKIVRMDG